MPLMPYVPPPIENLEKAVTNLQYAGPHKAIFDQLKALQAFLTIQIQNTQDMYIGILVLALMQVSKRSNPKTTLFLVVTHGSELARQLTDALNIKSDNALSAGDKLFYLHKLIQLLNSMNLGFTLSDYNTPAMVINTTLKLLGELLLDHPDIDDLLDDMPAEKTLADAFEELPDKFRKIKKGSGKPTERMAYIHFFEILSVCLAEQQIHKVQMNSRNKFGIIENRSMAYQIRFGALMYAMAQIESEYTYSSPENSDLYKCCQEASLSKQSEHFAARIECFMALFNYIPQVILYLEGLPANSIDPYEKMASEFAAKDMPFLKNAQGQLCKIMSKLFEGIKPESYAFMPCISNFINHSVKYGLNIVTVTAVCSLAPTAAGSMLGIGAAALGTSYFGAIGGAMGRQIGNATQDAITKGALTTVISAQIEAPVQNSVRGVVAKVAYFTLNIPVRIHTTVTSYFGNVQKANTFADPRCIEALFTLPPEVFPADKQLKLCQIKTPSVISTRIQSSNHPDFTQRPGGKLNYF
jgi:hypothetical protein